MKSDRLASVPRWRTGCRVGGHELASHAEQVPQDIGCHAGQANQHGGIVEIVGSGLRAQCSLGSRLHISSCLCAERSNALQKACLLFTLIPTTGLFQEIRSLWFQF